MFHGNYLGFRKLGPKFQVSGQNAVYQLACLCYWKSSGGLISLLQGALQTGIMILSLY